MTQQLAQWACLVMYLMWQGLLVIAVIRETASRNSQSAVTVAIVAMLTGIFGLLLRAAGTFTMIF